MRIIRLRDVFNSKRLFVSCFGAVFWEHNNVGNKVRVTISVFFFGVAFGASKALPFEERKNSTFEEEKKKFNGKFGGTKFSRGKLFLDF